MADLDSAESKNNDDPVQKVKKFMQDGCGCTLSGKGGQCCEQFSEETVLFNLNNCQELSHGELDLVILTSIQAFTRSDPIGGKRNRSPRSSFFFQSKPICKDIFFYIFMELAIQDFISSKNIMNCTAFSQGHTETQTDYPKTRCRILQLKMSKHFF